MAGKLFVYLNQYAGFRRIFWKHVYNFLAGRFQNPEWKTMNFGYKPTLAEGEFPFPQTDILTHYPLQMYHYLALNGNLAEKKVLEVGSGRGGGANFLYHHHHPQSYTGLDIAPNAIQFCQSQYEGEKLHFVEGNAEKLPFEKNTFEVVINIESCNEYGSLATFFSEVYRVLKPNGLFLVVVMRWKEDKHLFDTLLKDANFKTVKEENITQGVLASLDAQENARDQKIQAFVPKHLHLLFREFIGSKGSFVYKALEKEERMYLRYVLQKT